MGLSPWANSHDVYLEKTGQLPEWEGNEATHLGDLLEPAVLKLASERLGDLIVPDTKIAASCPVLAVNTDSLVVAGGDPVEAKTHSIAGGWSDKDEWGDEGTDEVPLSIIVQCQCHLIAHEREICHVPALIGRRGFVMYEVRRNAEVVKAIEEQAFAFWDRVTALRPPEIAPHLEEWRSKYKGRATLMLKPATTATVSRCFGKLSA